MSPPTTTNQETEDPATDDPIGPSPYQVRVFGTDIDEWNRITAACYDARTFRCAKIAMKMSTCCQNPMIYSSDDDNNVRMAERRCRSRCCPRCAKFRANELTSKLIAVCRRMDSRRMITLTLRSVDHPLREQLIELRRCFGRLRRSKAWKSRVTGGVYTVEVTMNNDTGLWHPHLHAIVDGSYFPCMELKASWEKASNGSTIAHIRAVPSATAAARYVSSYVSKTSDAVKFSDTQVAEWAEEVHGLRLASTFGNLHGVKLEDEEDVRVKCRKELQHVNELAEAARDGDDVADSIIRKLQADARGKPEEDNDVLSSRVRTWRIARDLIEARSRTEALPPDVPPPQQPELIRCQPTHLY